MILVFLLIVVLVLSPLAERRSYWHDASNALEHPSHL
jgi:hypothetical protein